MARALRNAGHFVVVASPSDGPYRQRLRDVGVDVIVDEVLLGQGPEIFDLARNFDKVICNTIVCWPAVEQLHGTVDTYWYVHESEVIRKRRDPPDLPGGEKGGPDVGPAAGSRLLSMYDAAHAIIECGVEDHRDGLCPALRHDAERVVIGVFGSYELRKGQEWP